jgi:Protein of unknown function (DUF2844)
MNDRRDATPLKATKLLRKACGKELAVALSALLLGSAPAWAVLGQSVESVQSDRESLKGRLLTIPREGYSVHQISRDDGTVVKEFVSSDGKVFGVTWQGPAMPNLAQLLGTYFPQFQEAARTAIHRRAPVALRTSELVVESGGHMRAFHGRAYLKSLIPNNLTQADVQ